MRKLLIAVPLVGLLVAAVWFAVAQWEAVDVGALPGWAFAAIGFGVLFSLLVGVGLMALVFYSSRHGYDDAVGGDHKPPS